MRKLIEQETTMYFSSYNGLKKQLHSKQKTDRPKRQNSKATRIRKTVHSSDLKWYRTTAVVYNKKKKKNKREKAIKNVFLSQNRMNKKRKIYGKESDENENCNMK